MQPARPMLLSVLALLMFPCSAAGREPNQFENRVAEYIRKYPYQQTYEYAARYTASDPARLNTWAFAAEPKLVRAGEDIVPRTNHDTYYQAATLWLGDGPVVLASTAPSTDRFNSFQLIDERNANYRNIIYPRGEYTLYFGAKPDRIRGEAIAVPSRLSVVLVRVEVKDENDPADVAAAKAVLKGMRIDGKPPAQFPRLDLLSGFPADIVDEAHRRMDRVFASVPFTQLVVGPGQEPGRDVPYLHHAAATRHAFGAPDPRNSAYEVIFCDGNGNELEGINGPYTMTTVEPPVEAFWSVTVYDRDRGGFLHPNPGARYHINDTLANRNVDGTVTFTFRRTCRDIDPNCLEVPAGRFDLVARYYLPHKEIIAGAWALPKVWPAHNQ